MTTDEILAKATPRPWKSGWGNGCTGSETAALISIDTDSNLPIIHQPDAIKQSDSPEHWYGRGVARTVSQADADFIVLAVNSFEKQRECLRELVEAFESETCSCYAATDPNWHSARCIAKRSVVARAKELL